MSEKKHFPCWVGVDVSKDSFTAAFQVAGDERTLYPAQDSFGLDRAGVRRLLKWMRGCAGALPCGIAMETTGRCSERLAALILKEAPGQHVAVCNALAVSRYRSSYTCDKADRHVDPKYIAKFACDRQPEAYTPMAKEAAELRELVRARVALVEACQRLRNRQGDLQTRLARDASRQVVAVMERKIKKLDAAIRSLVEKEEEIRREVELMVTVPGVGIPSAATIYAELGTLSGCSRRQLSALSGICPSVRQSGTSLRKGAMSRRGSRLLRRTLFLDSQQAINKIPSVASLHERLLRRPNSTRMTAKCACMRKLLMIIRGVVVSGKPFDQGHVPENFTHFEKKGEKTA